MRYLNIDDSYEEISYELEILKYEKEKIELLQKIPPQLKLGIYTKLCVRELYKYSPIDLLKQDYKY